MNILGIIPARGGSKAIKKKNLKKLNGKPLIYYTIKAALDSKFLKNIIVSTDDPEIAEVSCTYGINVDNLRPKHLSTDNASTWSVVNYELNRLSNDINKYDFVMMLQPTTPFRSSKLIDNFCNEAKANPNIDSIISIVNVGANHPHRMYTMSESKQLISFVKGINDPMMARQLLPPVYIRSGDIYLTKKECIINKKSLIGDISKGIEINSNLAINIDTEQDFILAEHLMKKY